MTDGEKDMLPSVPETLRGLVLAPLGTLGVAMFLYVVGYIRIYHRLGVVRMGQEIVGLIVGVPLLAIYVLALGYVVELCLVVPAVLVWPRMRQPPYWFAALYG